MPVRLERAAPAKVNLALHVTGRRADGYHLLESLVVFTRYADRLRVREAEADSFLVRGSFATQLKGEKDNLVIRARDLLRQHFGGEAAAPVSLELEKNLPVAAGIGGGSSDAAAALALLSCFWELDVSKDELARLGLALGADVPMCLSPRPLLARGIGEALEPVDLPALALLLVNPGVPLLTPAVFDTLPRRENPPLPAMLPGGSLQDIAHFLRTTRNDLEAAALSLAPEIGDLLSLLRANGALIARMSGSGATCFGLFDTVEAAERAGAAIAASNPGWFVRATVTSTEPLEA
ncbi:4-(cytidine 5'-diphospho)-2-C-methyl-D-erythritol kinase [Chelativorans sp. Marseille-P2723]|uniref:4-(cytidine 5'-diphospho)-2-C-methyl-D-erythritol kinase n=1 Tax=Chelativorans sp. Marseille-P2723 TaxID=2709133 RepID=UPI00156D817B|nr:4-(cytidine 5'-diphospho)-2-C-methyl-D-erythritol kinase [Chelativorans sp. Marseille-P2723]